MAKVAFILHGYTEHKSSRPAYGAIERAFRAQGYKVHQAKIGWKQGRRSRTFDEIVPDFVSGARKHIARGDKVALLGFSFGAIVALMSAQELGAKHLLLCSLSPYFKQDLHRIPKSWIVGVSKRYATAMRKLDFNKYVVVKAKTILLCGSNEDRMHNLEHRAHEAHRLIKGSKLIIVPGAKHDIGNPDYLAIIKEEMAKL